MDLGSLLIIAALVTLTLLYVTRPLFEKTKRFSNPDIHAESQLFTERDLIVKAIRDLDFDFSMQRIEEKDYKTQRAILVSQGVDILRQIDLLNKSDESSSLNKSQSISVDEATAQTNAMDDPLEVKIADRRRAKPEKAAGFCPKCGNPILKSDRFCWKCGEKVFNESTE